MCIRTKKHLYLNCICTFLFLSLSSHFVPFVLTHTAMCWELWCFSVTYDATAAVTTATARSTATFNCFVTYTSCIPNHAEIVWLQVTIRICGNIFKQLSNYYSWYLHNYSVDLYLHLYVFGMYIYMSCAHVSDTYVITCSYKYEFKDKTLPQLTWANEKLLYIRPSKPYICGLSILV